MNRLHGIARQSGLRRERLAGRDDPVSPGVTLGTAPRRIVKPAAGRSRPVALLEIPTPDDLIALCLRERPRLLVLNISTSIDAVAVARKVRSTLEISDTALAAIAERDPGRLGDELKAAGFDSVLTKPFLFTEIERLLAA